MKLKINNLAKVGSAELDFDGITVIVGDNNTGKSTLGKALFAMFVAFHDIDKRVDWSRRSQYASILSDFSGKHLIWDLDEHQLAQSFSDGSVSLEAILDLVSKHMEEEQSENDIEGLGERLREVMQLTSEELRCQIAYNVFANIFHHQYRSFLTDATIPEISLYIKGKPISVRLLKNTSESEIGFQIQHSAFYIDSPDTLSALADFNQFKIWRKTTGTLGSFLAQKVWDGFNVPQNGEASAVDEVLRRKRFGGIEQQMKSLMQGSLVYSKDVGLQFVSDSFSKNPLRLDNLSQGLKSMALLQLAFMNGTIGDNDVLILDEPEIHLHPIWQMKYAEFIVLLQKEFHLTVLLTSHSPDFIQAIRLYSKKHGLHGSLNGYVVSEGTDGLSRLEKIENNNWDVAFERFATSFDALMELRADLENPHEHELR